MSDELARILAAQPHQQQLEKAVRDDLARQKWGPDAPWYLRESLVGDVPYRYQGVALHGLLGALGLATGQPAMAWPNLGYVAYSLASGRTKRPQIGEEGIPPLKNAPY